MKTKVTIIIFSLFLFTSCLEEKKKALTTLPTAGGAPEELKINTLGWVDSPWISGDGLKMYFMYSRYNFFPTFPPTSALPRLEGPARLGHNNVDVNPYHDSDIYVSNNLGGNSWSEPVNLSLNDTLGDCCHIFVSNHSRIYYTKEIGGSSNINYRDLDASGNPTALPMEIASIKSLTNEDNPHVNEAGNLMWFTSSRAGGQGGKDIWFSSFSGGNWQAPINAGAIINTTADEDQFFKCELSNNIYFNRDSSIYYTEYDPGGDTFSAPVKVELGFDYVGEASMPNDESYLYFGVADPPSERIKIYRARKLTVTTFDTPEALD